MTTFTISRSKVLAALARANRFTVKRGDNARLACVHVNGSVELSAFDGDANSIEAIPHDSKAGADASFAIDGKQLETVLKSRKVDTVACEFTGSALSVCGVSVPTQAELQQVNQSRGDYLGSFEVYAVELAGAIDALACMADTESSRYTLGCILFEVPKDTGFADCVATDGRRLGHLRLAVAEVDAPSPMSIMVPVDVCKKAATSLKRLSNSVRVEVFERVAVLNCGAFSLSIRLAEGRYPKWRDVVPTYSAVNSFECQQVADAMQAVKALATDDSRGVKWAFDGGSWAASFEGSTVATGAIEGLSPFISTIGLDYRYTADAVAAIRRIGCERFHFHADTHDRAVMFRSESGRLSVVIMPINFNR
jgi:DNA polymerase III sliding clamp (beta) subunit (PCNA family)